MSEYLKRNSTELKVLFIYLFALTAIGFCIVKYNSVPPEIEAAPEIQKTTIIEEKVFGYSVTGRPIDGYEIGSGGNVILFMGAIHGDEMGTADLLNSLVDEIKADPSIVSQNRKLIIIPISNPDGYYDRTDKLNANSVNLNLNFATLDWQDHGPEGTFAGDAPFSEPESVVIKDIVEQYNPSVMISYHSQGALVTPEATPASELWARWYADKVGYAYFDDWDFPGMATKWFVEATHNPAITVEITWNLQSDWEMHEPVLRELISSDDDPVQIYDEPAIQEESN
ncbi:MAG: M14 family zinc carboxypeptidase [Candidatus Azambacteria bacterium]|nr:M14 family zinc carboxypeptidase [Candidatus Azambacteria bacterium]